MNELFSTRQGIISKIHGIHNLAYSFFVDSHMDNQNNSYSDNTPRKRKEMEEMERLGQRIKEMQLELDFLEGTYVYSKSSVILDPDDFPAKLKFVKVLNNKWSVVCFQN